MIAALVELEEMLEMDIALIIFVPLSRSAGRTLKRFGQYYVLMFGRVPQNELEGASQGRWAVIRCMLRK